MIRFDKCNKLIDRLMSICHDNFTAIAEAHHHLECGNITHKEYIHVERRLRSL